MNWPMPGLHRAVVTVLFALLFAGCGGTDRRRSVNSSATTQPHFLELRSNISAGTIHFPRGIYSLETEDRNGYYYPAPGKVYQHSVGGSYGHGAAGFGFMRN